MLELDRISITAADFEGKEAEVLIDSLFKSEWIYWSTDDSPRVKELATLFVNNHAKIEIAELTQYGTTPVCVFRNNRGKEEERYIVEGVFYCNGAVMLENKERVHLWIDESTAKLFRYPILNKPS